jgi:hypothetical protein
VVGVPTLVIAIRRVVVQTGTVVPTIYIGVEWSTKTKLPPNTWGEPLTYGLLVCEQMAPFRGYPPTVMRVAYE